MCGIAGGVGLAPGGRPDRGVIERMSHSLRHRGPDGEGLWESDGGRALLAHRRLSVIDLETGQQPFVNESGTVGLVFNGEIYNYCELRDELIAEGVTFRTRSDTEVLLRLYERRGTDCIGSLRGMFAFAIWDNVRGRLVLARDRIGKKPLYMARKDGCLYFASSFNGLRKATGDARALNLAAVDSYMTLGYVPAPGTIVEGIEKLEAATMLVIENGTSVRQRYWDLATLESPFVGTFDDAVDRLDEILGTAVSIRLRSDVPLGVFLSGGIDSSLVTALAARHSALPVHTFSIGFDDAAFDESAYASRVAAHLGTIHRTFRVQPDVLSLLPDYVGHFGEPFADSSAFPSWVLAHETRQHVTVALGGDGGDEGFGGYDWYRTASRLQRLGQMIPVRAAALTGRALGHVGAGGTALAGRAARLGRGLSVIGSGSRAAQFSALRVFISDRDAGSLYAGELAEHRRALGPVDRNQLAELYESCEGSDLRRMRYADVRTYLADCLMPKVDVATMAHGLEARAPLLDQEVLEFALSLPDEFVADEDTTKKPLRRLLARYVPPALFERPKQGFTPPLSTWFSGALSASVGALATSDALMATGWFSSRGIARMLADHVAGERDNSQRLFQLVVLDAWLRQR